jgi:hypothetical protein
MKITEMYFSEPTKEQESCCTGLSFKTEDGSFYKHYSTDVVCAFQEHKLIANDKPEAIIEREKLKSRQEGRLLGLREMDEAYQKSQTLKSLQTFHGLENLRKEYIGSGAIPNAEAVR